MKSERLYKIDNLKLFLIMCVVLGHVAAHFVGHSYSAIFARFWVYLFHMPGFVFVSGLFSKNTIKGNRWNKIVPYVFLFVGMQTLSFLVNALENGFSKTSVSFFSANGVAWFALAMVWWHLICILVKRVHPAYVLTVSVILAMVSGYSTEIGSFLVLQRTIVFFPFFYLGYILDVAKTVAFLNKKWVRIVSALILILSLVLAYFFCKDWAAWRSLFRGRYAYKEIKVGMSIAWGWLWRLGFYVISGILVAALISVMPNVKTPITFLGQKTLSVYAFHYAVMTFVLNISAARAWLETGQVAIKILVFSIVLLLFTATPLFDWPVRKLMNVPLVDTNKK